MHLRLLSEAKKNFFTYDSITKDMWYKKLREAMDKFNIHFSNENDDEVVQREIKVDQDFWEFTVCKFKCEMRAACGDWEVPIRYFRVEIADGYCTDAKPCSDPHFVVIPGREHGNLPLIKSKNGGQCPIDANSKKSEAVKPDEKACWAWLEKYLTKSVYDEIRKVKSEHKAIPVTTPDQE